MKQLILFFLVLTLKASAQKQIYCTIDFHPMGSGFAGIASFHKTTDSFYFSSRILPSVNFRLLQADSITIAGDSVSGKMRLLNYFMLFKGIAKPDSVNITLISSKTGALLGTVKGSTKPVAKKDFAMLSQQIIDTTEKQIFNKTYVENKEWDLFKKNLLSLSPFLNDDLEMLLLFYREAKLLPFTHFELTKRTAADYQNMLQEPKDNERTASLNVLGNQTALLKIADFNGDGSRIDSLMRVIVRQGHKALVIDLRGNGGGGAGAAMELTKYLSPKPQPAGAIVTRQWFNRHSAPPNATEYSLLTPFSKGSTRMLIQSIPHTLGFYLHIEPAAQLFTGQLYILTDGRTASTCEPLVYGMQLYKRATVVGTKTAGAVLSKIPVPLGGGYVLLAPMADYFTIDGKRLDKVGVLPDVIVPAEQALEKTIELIAGATTSLK